jgi:hypothetical protein
MKLKNGRNLKKHPFNDKTEDTVKFRVQEQRRKLQVQKISCMIIALGKLATHHVLKSTHLTKTALIFAFSLPCNSVLSNCAYISFFLPCNSVT